MELGCQVQSVVVQPTTACNINCAYCYLPARDRRLTMSDEVASAVARSLAAHCTNKPINIIWHGGEPTATGLDRFSHLLEIFHSYEQGLGFRHGIQTNATLIDDAWCDLIKTYKISVGVSIDGPEDLNCRRVTRSGAPTYRKAMEGVQRLLENQVRFNAIAVVGREGLVHASKLYSFFSSLGCYELGINLEESEGTHADGLGTSVSDSLVQNFWQELWSAWHRNPTLAVRELRQVIEWMKEVASESRRKAVSLDPFPTIGWDGTITFLSPELLGGKSDLYDNFVAGNVLTSDLYSTACSAIQHSFVRDFMHGVNQCAESCAYFGFCKGGQASNKFYETGSTNATETNFCRHGAKSLIDASMTFLNESVPVTSS